MFAENLTAAFPEFETWSQEISALDSTLSRIAPDDWKAVTPFKGWRVFDHVHHLAITDGWAEQAAARPEEFRADRIANPPGSMGALGKDGPPDISAEAMLERWREGVALLAKAMAPLDPQDRLPWFGPEMSVRAFVTARQMETWSHGQTIHDTLGLRREVTDRIRPICEIGWRTRGWSFAVNNLPPPDEPVHLSLASPSGETWVWGDDTASNCISGTAEDFALTVCQCRNVADTGLVVEGNAAKAWMDIAQCFAGAANLPPRPGERVPAERVTT